MFLKTCQFIVLSLTICAAPLNAKELSLRKSRVAFAKGKMSEKEIEAKLKSIKKKVSGKKDKLAQIEQEIGYFNLYKELMAAPNEEADQKLKQQLKLLNEIASQKFGFGHFDKEKDKARYLLAFFKRKKDVSKESAKAIKMISTYLGYKIRFSFTDAKKLLDELKDESIKAQYKNIMKRFVEMETHNQPKEDILPEEQAFLN